MTDFDNNKATPTKRTGDNYNDNSSDRDYVNDNNSGQNKSVELPQPNSTTATPKIPTEMPSRVYK